MEVILAASLLGLVISFLFQLYPTSLMAIRRGENQLEAGELARSALEDYRSRPFASLTPGTIELGNVTGAGKAIFRRSLTIEQVTPRLMELRSLVEWTVRAKNYKAEHAIYVSKVRP